MATQLSVRAVEESTYVVAVAFLDEVGDEVIPETIVWSLTDLDGNVINSRSDVEVSPTAASINIVLSGDDLAISSTLDRVVTVEATYNSAYGVDLPLRAAAKFSIENLVVI
jgi:hypothetical protein